MDTKNNKLEQDTEYILSLIEVCGWDFSTLDYKEEDFIVHWAQDNYYRRCDAGILSRLIINTNHLQDPLDKHQLKTLETLNNKHNIQVQ